MAKTNESYQQARAQILMTRNVGDPRVDLLPIRYFGGPAALATFEIAGRLAVLVVSGTRQRLPFPQNPLLALGSPRTLH
ncbi:MAG: hypothetical protein ABI183_01180 [Polyangiaceae bacterium]